MSTIINIGDKYLAACGVPEKEIMILGKWLAWAHKKNPVEFLGSVELPSPGYSILGRLNELTEEQCAEIAVSLNDDFKPGQHYPKNWLTWWVEKKIDPKFTTTFSRGSNPLILEKL